MPMNGMEQNENYCPDVPGLLLNWGLKANSWDRVKDVYKVHTDRGLMNLKISPLIPKRLAFVHQAVQHLISTGFERMNPIIPTIDGRTYIDDGVYAYTLFQWVPGRQCNFKNQKELVDSTKILAEFHRKTAGFAPPPASNMRDRLGKCRRHFEERYQELMDYQAMALQRPNDPFAAIYLENVNFFLPMALKALEKLNDSCYQQLVDLAVTKKTFCHGDPAARNFIITPDQEIFVIDFDSCRLDLPVMDLIKFTRRVLKKHHWNVATAKVLIDAYQQVSPLSPGELDVMKAVFYFPQKFWRMANRHFHEHGRHTPERALQKFKKYLQNKKALSLFQQEFETYHLPSEKS